MYRDRIFKAKVHEQIKVEDGEFHKRMMNRSVADFLKNGGNIEDFEH